MIRPSPSPSRRLAPRSSRPGRARPARRPGRVDQRARRRRHGRATSPAKIELLVDPPPDRPIEAEVHVTPRPVAEPRRPPRPDARRVARPRRAHARADAHPDAGPAAGARGREPVRPPGGHFITEVDHEWCAVAGTQMVLAAHGKAALTEAFQRKLASRIGEWESRRDSLNGGWGPVRDGLGPGGVRRPRATRSAPTRPGPTRCRTRPARSRRSMPRSSCSPGAAPTPG